MHVCRRYSAATYFYPWVHYVLRNHFHKHLARLPHVLAIPLGYKKVKAKPYLIYEGESKAVPNLPDLPLMYLIYH